MDHFLSNYNWVPIEQKFDLFSKELKAELKEDETTLRIIKNIFKDTKNINPYDRVLHFFEKNPSRLSFGKIGHDEYGSISRSKSAIC